MARPPRILIASLAAAGTGDRVSAAQTVGAAPDGPQDDAPPSADTEERGRGPLVTWLPLVLPGGATVNGFLPPDPDALAIPALPAPAATQTEPQVDERAQAAGALRGDLTFTIIWDGRDDLDLHVTCPAGDTLYFMKTATCNGTLDVDSNAQEIAANPIENAHFSDPPRGTYRLRVHLYKPRDRAGARPFTLQISDHGRVTTHRGRVTRDQPDWHHDYQYKGQ